MIGIYLLINTFCFKDSRCFVKVRSWTKYTRSFSWPVGCIDQPLLCLGYREDVWLPSKSVCSWISWLGEGPVPTPRLCISYSMPFIEVNIMTESTFSLGDTICKSKNKFTAWFQEINLWAWWKLEATKVEAMMLLEAGTRWHHAAYCRMPCF